jgi:hypothetical protein
MFKSILKLKIPYTQNVGKKLNIPAGWWTKGVALKNEGGCFESPTGPKSSKHSRVCSDKHTNHTSTPLL